jgi:hypothetical protein
MNLSWEEEFNAVMASFGTIVPDLVEYRLHYDDTGCVTMCSQQNHPDSQQYLVVNREEYENYYQYVVDIEKKKLKKVVVNPGVSVQLKRSTKGYAVIRHHAGLLLEDGELHKDIEYYESNN